MGGRAPVLKFRNLNFNPSAPVEEWPFEAISTAVERGTLPDWRRLASAVRRDPWGPLARQVEEVLAMGGPYGIVELFEGVIEAAREDTKAKERSEVANEVAGLVERSGLSLREFAKYIGTSAPRLSTYMNGTVTPSSTLMNRMRRVGAPR
jgi:predicted XRE-type DNA-binding protein